MWERRCAANMWSGRSQHRPDRRRGVSRHFRSIRVFAECANRIVHWTEMERGGHFGAIEAPGALVADLRAFVRGELS